MAETTKRVLELEIDVDSGDVRALNKDIDKTAKSTEKAQKGVGGLASGFKKVGTALKAAGIGLVVALLAKLADVLSENQKVADGFETAMTALSLAFNDLFKFISNNISTVTDFFKQLFDDPLGNLKALGNAIKENLIERFNSLIETLGLAGKAISQIFEGDFTGALETAKEAGKELIDVYTGVDGTFDKVVETTKSAFNAVVDYTKSTIASADALTQQAKAMQFSELASRRLQLQYQKDAEVQRQIRDDETKSFEERIAANEKLGEILVESAKAEQAEVQKRIDFINQQNNLLGVTQERLLEIEALRIEQLDIEERITGFQSEQLINRNSLLREQADYEQSLIDARLEAERKASEEAIALARKEAEEKQKLQDASFSVATSTLTALSALSESFAKDSEKGRKAAFQQQKALGIASAVISTSEAAINAYKAMVGIPVVGPVLGPVAAGAAIAAGVAQINNIRKQKYEGSVSSSTPSISSGSAPSIQPQAPQFNTVGTSGFNQLSESIAGQNEKTVKAYVVASDVSSAQSLDRNRVKQASFP